jgi:hypothetical protein
MKWFLVILALSPSGDFHIKDGWHPIEQKSAVICNRRVEVAEMYIQRLGMDAAVMCVEAMSAMEAGKEAMK